MMNDKIEMVQSGVRVLISQVEEVLEIWLLMTTDGSEI